MNRDFVKFAIESGVLRFGQFTLKSGRTSPYFFNAGLFNSGASLARLGEFYAQALIESEMVFDQLFGPAYKGIPLVSSASIALHRQYQLDVPYLYNRKEVKDHGEGGTLVGAAPNGRIAIIDDVITAGTAIREAIQMIADQAEVAGVIVAIDRQERGETELSAIQEIKQAYGLNVISIVKLDDIIDYLSVTSGYGDELELMQAYRERYGIH